MRKRIPLAVAGLAIALGMSRSLLFSDPGDGDKAGIVRIAAPAAPPAIPASSPIAPSPSAPTPTPTPAAEPGIDPPAPPQEKNSPDYAKLGVQPAI